MTGPHPIDWDRWVRLKGRIDAAKATDGWRIASDAREGAPAHPSPAGAPPRVPGVRAPAGSGAVRHAAAPPGTHP